MTDDRSLRAAAPPDRPERSLAAEARSRATILRTKPGEIQDAHADGCAAFATAIDSLCDRLDAAEAEVGRLQEHICNLEDTLKDTACVDEAHDQLGDEVARLRVERDEAARVVRVVNAAIDHDNACDDEADCCQLTWRLVYVAAGRARNVTADELEALARLGAEASDVTP